MNKNSALVLEGGALRSFFTSGVLDVFMENNIYFPCVCGVSAGSLCGINYLSRQIGRTAEINLKFINDKRYLSLRSLIKNKMIFNFDFLFGEISHELVPLDFNTFFASSQNLVAFTTDCSTGKSVAFEKNSGCDILTACRASSSMPLLSKIVSIDGGEYLDGGVSLPMPYQWAFDNGYNKTVLVLTRDISYRKQPLSGAVKKIYAQRYSKYPQLLDTIYRIPQHYNELCEEIVELEKQGKIFVIRPEEPVTVKRTEKDKQKLTQLYHTGRETGMKRLDAMLEYLQK